MILRKPIKQVKDLVDSCSYLKLKNDVLDQAYVQVVKKMLVDPLHKNETTKVPLLQHGKHNPSLRRDSYKPFNDDRVLLRQLQQPLSVIKRA